MKRIRKTCEDYNDGKLNLCNTTKNKLGRTKAYIDDIEPRHNWYDKEDKILALVKIEALQLIEPNDMLERIGFNPVGRDGVLYECESRSREITRSRVGSANTTGRGKER